MHGLMSYRCFRRARSLRNDRTLVRARSLRSYRAEWAFGRYVAIELWLELGRYVATERGTRLVAAKRSFSSSCPMIRVSSAKRDCMYVLLEDKQKEKKKEICSLQPGRVTYRGKGVADATTATRIVDRYEHHELFRFDSPPWDESFTP
uniref:Uncharacterized protein n=1 Tax=Brassica oleracea var. oleracea TaxID=109376 RepID=A0A0D3D689_BRAOL